MVGEVLPVKKKTKLLGTIICDDLKWDENTAFLVKKANSRLLLLRKASEYTNSTSDLKSIYISHIRGILEQSCVIWHSSLSEENIIDLERVKKNACRIILGNLYTDYNESQEILQLENLSLRRKKLSLKFAQNCQENPKTKHFFLSKSKNMTWKKEKLKSTL